MLGRLYGMGARTTAMRDLRSDWRRWSRTERIVSLVALVAAAIGVLPYLFIA